MCLQTGQPPLHLMYLVCNPVGKVGVASDLTEELF